MHLIENCTVYDIQCHSSMHYYLQFHKKTIPALHQNCSFHSNFVIENVAWIQRGKTNTKGEIDIHIWKYSTFMIEI